MSATAGLVLTFDTSWLSVNFNNVVPPIADLVEYGGGVQVDRGDGIPVSYNPEDVITLTGSTLIITGDFRTFGYGSIWPGAVGLTSFHLDNLGSITNLNGACYGSVALTSITGFAEADVSQVTDMSNMFRGATGLYTEIGAFRFDLTAWPNTAAHTLFLSPDGFQDTSETDANSPFYLGTSISLNFATSPTLSTHWTNTLPYFPNTVITVTLIGQGGGGGVDNNIAVSYGGSGAGVKFSYTVTTGIPVGELTIHTGTGGGTAGTAAQDSVDENGDPITIPGVQPGSGEASYITIKDGNDTYQITANGGSAVTTPTDNAGGTVSVTLNGEPDNTGITFIVGPTAGSNGTPEGSGVNGYTSAGGVGLSTYGIGGGQGSAGSPGYASLDLSLPITLPISDITSSAVVVNFGAEQLRFTAGQDISGVTTGFVQIYGDFTTFGLGNVAWENVVYITGFTWGINTPQNLNGAFNGATQLTSVPTTLPSSVTSMSYMFSGCTAFTGGNGALTNWDVSTVVDMSYMFVGSGLTETAGFSTWTPSSATTLDRMFSGATALYNQDGSFKVDLTGWETSITGTPTYTYFLSPTGSNDTTESDIKSPFYVEPPPTLTQRMNLTFAASTAVTLPISGIDANGLSIDWNDGNGYTPYATGATVSGTTGTTGIVDISGNFATFGDGAQAWAGVESLLEVNVFVLTGVTSLAGAFNGATSFVGSTINTWDVSTVTNVDYMFSGATALYDENGFKVDLTGWTPTITGTPVQFFSPDGTEGNDTTTTDNNSPFYVEPTTTLTLTFDSTWLAANQNTVTPPISGILPNSAVIVDDSTDASNLVQYDPNSPDITLSGTTLTITGNFATFGNGASSWAGAAGLTKVVVYSIETITNLSGAFHGCVLLSDISGGAETGFDSVDLSNVTDMSYMFKNCYTFNGNVSNFNTSAVTNMAGMFSGCENFNESVPFTTTIVTDMSNMFNGCIKFNKPVPFDTSVVTNMTSMFNVCSAFNEDLTSFTTNVVTNMSSMFNGCTAFTGGNGALTDWNVSSVNDMGIMFNNSGITETAGFSSWTPTSVTILTGMFSQATALYNQDGSFKVDLTGWKTFIPGSPSRALFLSSDGTAENDTTETDPYSPFYVEPPPTLTQRMNLTFAAGITVTLPISNIDPNGIAVNWDGTGYTTYANGATVSGTTGTNGPTAIVDISGNFATFGLGDQAWAGVDSLLEVNVFVLTGVTSLAGAFNGATSFVGSTINTWDVSTVTNVDYMFSGATALYNQDESFKVDLTGWTPTITATPVQFFSPNGTEGNDTTTTDPYSPFYIDGPPATAAEIILTFDKTWIFGIDSSPKTIELPISGITDLAIWDGSVNRSYTSANNGTVSWDFSATDPADAETYRNTLTVTGTFTTFSLGAAAAGLTGVDVALWGTITNLNSAFKDATQLTTATFVPTSSAVTNMSLMFSGAAGLYDENGFKLDLTAWDVTGLEGVPDRFFSPDGTAENDTTTTDTNSPFYVEPPPPPPTLTQTMNLTFAANTAVTLPISGIDANGIAVNWDGTGYTPYAEGEEVTGTTGETGIVDISGNFSTFGLGAQQWTGVISLSEVNVFVLTGVTSLAGAFNGATSFVGSTINTWDVSTVANVDYMFSGATDLYNQDESFKVDLTGWTPTAVSGTPVQFFSPDGTAENDTTTTDTNSPFYVEPPPPPPTLTQTMNLTFAANTAVTLPISGIDANGIAVNWDGTGYTTYTTEQTVSGTTGETGIVDISGNFATFGLGDQQWTGVDTLSEVNVFVLTGVTSLAGAFNGATSFVGSTINTWDVSTVANLDYMFSGATGLYDENGFKVDLTEWTPTAVSGTPVQFFSPDGTAENDTTTTDTNSPFYSSTPPPPPTSSLSLTFDETWLIAHEYKVTPPIHGMNGEVLVDLGGGAGGEPYTEGTELTMAGVTLAINGNFTTFGNGDNSWPGAAGLVSCIATSIASITNLSGAFNGCEQFTDVNPDYSLDIWTVTQVTDMSHMFRGCAAFNNTNLGNWERTGLNPSTVQFVTSMKSMFALCNAFVGTSIDAWNVSNVTDFSGMFHSNDVFNNTNLGNWSLKLNSTGLGEINMSQMFYNAVVFEGTSIENWNMGNTVNTSEMFAGAYQFNNTLLGSWETWDRGSTMFYVNTMHHMFYDTRVFTGGNIDLWNVSMCTDFGRMFEDALVFNNTNLGNWERPAPDNGGGGPTPGGQSTLNIAGLNNVNMYSMFKGAAAFEGTTIGQWSVSSVTNMSRMFEGATAFTADLGGWNQQQSSGEGLFNIKDMSHMFDGATSFTGSGIQTWNPRDVTDMSYMFRGATSFNNMSLGYWSASGSTTENVTSMAYMFAGCTTFTDATEADLGVDAWNVKAVKDMSHMFDGATVFNNTNLGVWNRSDNDTPISYLNNVTSMAGMFKNAKAFTGETIENWNLYNIVDVSDMFNGATIFNNALLGTWQQLSPFPIGFGQNTYKTNMARMFMDASGFTGGTIGAWYMRDVTDVSDMFNGAVLFNADLTGWSTEGFGSGVNSPPINMSGMFKGATSFVGNGVDTWQVGYTNDFSNMFNGATAFANELLGNWSSAGSGEIGANVTTITMTGMFRGATSFTGIGAVSAPGIETWNVSKVTDMSYMFAGAIAFANQGLTNWGGYGGSTSSTTAVRNLSHMFDGATVYTDDSTSGIETWDVSSVSDMSYMFANTGAYNNINLGGWNTVSVQNMASMFKSATAFTGGNIYDWNVSAVTDMSRMFEGTTSFTTTNLGGWERAAPTVSTVAYVRNMSHMFNGSGTDGSGVDQWNVTDVTDMSYMFANSGVTNVSLGNWNTSMVKTMSNMFYGTAAFTGDSIDTWNVSAVTDMTNMFSAATAFNNDLGAWSTAPSSLTLVKTMAGMFSGATSFEGTGIDTWTLAVVTDMSNMFNGASVFNNSLLGAWQSVTSTVNTVNNMSGMFSGCPVFEGGNIDSWNISNVSDMSNMFNGASVFNSELPWDTSNVVTMNGMFTDASGFVGLSGIQNWNTSQVTTMAGMFQRASTFNQKLMRATSIWDTSKVVDFSNMFNGASVYLGEDISGWDVTSATSMVGMFANTTRFDKDLSYWSLPAVTAVDGMFAKATALYDGVNFKYDLTGWADTFTGNPTHSLFFSLDGETETTTADLKSPFYLVNLPPNITLYFDPVATPQLPLFEIGVDGIDINWHDGNDPQFYPHLSPGPFVPSGNLIEYPGAAGLAKVDISGSFGKFGKGIIPWNGVMDLYRVGGSGDGSLTNLSGAFANANSFTGIGLGAWDVSGVTDMSYMFMYSGITDVNLEAWDTSKVKNMSNMFLTAEEFVGNGVNQWDTSSVTDMSNMFNGAAMFNAALATNGSKWDTQLVRNMNSMFSTAPAFTGGGIDTWDTSSVTDMTRMFYNDTSFDNVNLGNWNVSTVRNMGSMFAGSAFSGWSISSWNVSNVTNMAEMFQGCPNFEEQNAGGNIGNWERTEPTVSTLANVTSMNSMFAYSTKFKGEGISTWNVVGVTDMTSMFQNGGLTSSLVDWAFSLNGVIPTPPNFLTDGTDDLTTTSPLSPFGPAPVIPTQTNSTSLLSFASPPNPSYKLAPGSTIYGTAGTKFYSTNTSGAYSEIMDLAEYGTPIGAMIGNPTHYNATVFTITQTQAGGSLFFYDTSSGLSGTIGTFAAQPLPNSVFDSVGNLYMVDTAGALYKVTPSMNNQVSTDTLPIVAQLGTIGLTSIDISNNVLCWVQSAGTLGGLDLTSVGTPPTLTQIPGLVQTFLIDSNKVYYYDSSSNLSVYTNETATTLWDFAANPTYGTTPTGDLFIDRTEQTIYGICTGGGPGFGKGFRGGGVLYRFTISTGEMDVITSYFRDDGVTGSGPVSFTVVPDNGQSYVVTSGSAVAPRLRSPFLVNPRAAGPNYQVSQSTLPGYVTSCFNYGVKILTQVHGAEAWRPVETLREGDIVKTYKHGYRPITHIGKGVLINDAAIWHSSMFKAQMEGFEPLIVTGGHSILVDYLTQEEQQKQAVFWERGEEVIDDKLLMIAPVSPLFTQIKERKLFTYFHFSVQNDGDDDRRYGVWANGFLTETPSVNQYKLHKYHDM